MNKNTKTIIRLYLTFELARAAINNDMELHKKILRYIDDPELINHQNQRDEQ